MKAFVKIMKVGEPGEFDPEHLPVGLSAIDEYLFEECVTHQDPDDYREIMGVYRGIHSGRWFGKCSRRGLLCITDRLAHELIEDGKRKVIEGKLRVTFHDVPDDLGRCHFTVYRLDDYHPGHPDGEHVVRERAQEFFADPEEHGFKRPSIGGSA